MSLASCGGAQAPVRTSDVVSPDAVSSQDSAPITAADGTVFSGQYAAQFAQAYADASTDIFRSVVSDGELDISDDEVMSSAYHACLDQFPDEQMSSPVHLTQAGTMVALEFQKNRAIAMIWDSRVTMVDDDVRARALEESAQCATAAEIDKLNQLAQAVSPMKGRVPLATSPDTMYIYQELYTENGLEVPQGTLTLKEYEQQILGRDPQERHDGELAAQF